MVSLPEPQRVGADKQRVARWPLISALFGFWGLVLAVQVLGLTFTFSRGPWLGTLFAMAVLLGLAAVFVGWRAIGRLWFWASGLHHSWATPFSLIAAAVLLMTIPITLVMAMVSLPEPQRVGADKQRVARWPLISALFGFWARSGTGCPGAGPDLHVQPRTMAGYFICHGGAAGFGGRVRRVASHRTSCFPRFWAWLPPLRCR